MEDTVLKLQEPFSEGTVEDDTALVSEPPPASDAGRDTYAEDKNGSVIGKKRTNDFKPKRGHHVFTHFPNDPICDERRISKTHTRR